MKQEPNPTQTTQLIQLMENGWVSPIRALEEVGCFRLASRVWDIKQMGYDVTHRDVRVAGKRWREYSINEEQTND